MSACVEVTLSVEGYGKIYLRSVHKDMKKAQKVAKRTRRMFEKRKKNTTITMIDDDGEIILCEDKMHWVNAMIFEDPSKSEDEIKPVVTSHLPNSSNSNPMSYAIKEDLSIE